MGARPTGDDTDGQTQEGDGQAKPLPGFVEGMALAKIGECGQAEEENWNHEQRQIGPMAEKPGSRIFKLVARKAHPWQGSRWIGERQAVRRAPLVSEMELRLRLRLRLGLGCVCPAGAARFPRRARDRAWA